MAPPKLPPAIEGPVARGFLRMPAPVLRRMVGPPVRSPEGYTLDLQLQALLWIMKTMKEPALHEGGVAAARARMDLKLPILDAADVRDVTTTDRRVDGAAGPLGARVYRPTGAPEPAPGLVFFHGGGFVLGSLASHDGLCRALASRARAVVVAVDYRLAPEHPFPAPADDAIAATRWVLAHAGELGIDPQAVAVGGDSAGGNLSAVVAQALRDELQRPAYQLLIYPATDLRRLHPSHKHFRDGFLLTGEGIDWFVTQYVKDAKELTNPRASPLLAEDFARLPPAFVVTAGFDPLRDEGDEYADKLRAAGVKVEHVRAEAMTHGFVSMAGGVREAGRMLDRIARALRAALWG